MWTASQWVKLLTPALAAPYPTVRVSGFRAAQGRVIQDRAVTLFSHLSAEDLARQQCAHQIEVGHMPQGFPREVLN